MVRITSGGSSHAWLRNHSGKSSTRIMPNKQMSGGSGSRKTTGRCLTITLYAGFEWKVWRPAGDQIESFIDIEHAGVPKIAMSNVDRKTAPETASHIRLDMRHDPVYSVRIALKPSIF